MKNRANATTRAKKAEPKKDVAQRIVDRMFTDGMNRRASSLQLRDGTSVHVDYMGGWCEAAVLDLIRDELAKETK